MGLKRNTKALSLALVAVFAFSALAAGSAQGNAPRWTVTTTPGGVEHTLTAAQSRPFHATSTGVVNLTSAGLGLRSKNNGDCTATGSIVGSEKGLPGKNKEVVLTCKNVIVLTGAGAEAPACTAHSVGAANGTVVTSKLESTLVWEQPNSNEDTKVGDTFAPEANTAGNFTTIEITGEACALAGKYNITGNVIATIEESGITKHTTTGQLEFPSTANKVYYTNQTPVRTKDEDAGLKLGANAATFEATFDITLNSDEQFGVEPG